MVDTAPATPSFLTHYITWLKAHEKLIIIGIGAFLLLRFYGASLKAWEAHDQRVSTAAAQQVKVDNTVNQQLQAQVTQLMAVVAQQQINLDKAMQQRAVQTVEQKKADAVMTPSDLAARFQHLLSVGPQDVQAAPITGNLVFTPPAAQANVSALEDEQQLRADKVDLQTELTGQKSLVAKQTDLLSGTQKELADEKTSHVADVKTLEVKVKRSWFRGFKTGVVVGAAGVEAIRIFVFHKP